MSKQALGSIPIFENVAKETEELDLFTKDAIEPNKEENLESKVKADLKKQILEEARRGKKELKEKNEPTEEIKIDKIREMLETEETPLEEPKDTSKKPNNKKGLHKGYIRQTFVIKEEHLELIKALSNLSEETTQASILEALIEAGLETIKEEVKEKALADYRKEQNKNKNEEAKKEIAKLFK